jgi:hypothetical protein
MIRAGLVALAALAAIDFFMCGGVYTHLVIRVADQFYRNAF